MLLFTAVIVTVSELFAVSPAAIVMVASEPTVYAPDTAVTVTVVAALEAWFSVADTVVLVSLAVELDSLIVAAATASVTVGAASSSVIVPTPVAAVDDRAALTGPLSVSFTVSFGSSCPSPITDTVIVFDVSPAANVSVPADTAV